MSETTRAPPSERITQPAAAARSEPTRALAAAIGNRAFAGVVARSRAAVLARTDSGARRVDTAFGSFDVFPDDFAGELPVAQPGAGQVWPMREAPFARLRSSMEAIAGQASPVTFGGVLGRPAEAAFRTAVLLDLAWLQTQPVGQELLQAIAGSHKALAITETLGDNMAFPADEKAADDPKLGSDATIRYNASSWSPIPLLRAGLPLPADVEPEEWMWRPPAIGLAHELVHAWTYMTGIAAAKGQRDQQAIGLGEFSDAGVHREQVP